MGSSWLGATRAQYDDETNLAARQALFTHLVAATPLPAPLSDMGTLAGRRVLDVGCGNGNFLAQASGGGATAIGTDLSLGMVKTARETAATPVFQADAEALPVADDAADVVLALWMLFHVEDQHRAISEMRRVLRPGGQLVASTNSGERDALDGLANAALSDVLGRPVEYWHAHLRFTAEDGAGKIGAVFDDVETHHFSTTFDVADAETLVRYVGSMTGPMREQHGEFDVPELLTAVGRRCDEMMAGDGAVRIERKGAVFLARA